MGTGFIYLSKQQGIFYLKFQPIQNKESFYKSKKKKDLNKKSSYTKKEKKNNFRMVNKYQSIGIRKYEKLN